jgi:hypothetical protein
MLHNDITRCRGEGSAGAVCAHRLECARYLAIAEDVVKSEQTGLWPFRSHAAMLCRPPNFPFLWPADDSKPMAERLRNKGYQPVPDAAITSAGRGYGGGGDDWA